LPRRLRDDARHERPGARSVSEMRWLTAPNDLRAEDQSLQLFEPDRGEIREGFRARRNRQGTGATEGIRAHLAPAASPAQPLGLADVIQAVTYMAQGNEVDGKPSLRYITLLRDGARAHGLPETHIQFLESVDHVQ
jgi:hypothetical protein